MYSFLPTYACVVVSLLRPWFAHAVVHALWPAVIDELKDEAAKRGGDAEAKADDGDKRKWMSTIAGRAWASTAR
jgi:hypothetical protein